MAMTIHVDVVSAEQSIFSGLAEFIAAPAAAGEVGIYPRHAPLISRMKPGTVRVKIPDQAEEELFFVSGGILEVQPQVVTILADTALRGKDLDEAKAHGRQATGGRSHEGSLRRDGLCQGGSRTGGSCCTDSCHSAYSQTIRPLRFTCTSEKAASAAFSIYNPVFKSKLCHAATHRHRHSRCR